MGESRLKILIDMIPDKFPTSEEDWEYNGPLSSSPEIHMATIGTVIGSFIGLSKTIREEISEEPQYLLGFAFVSFILAYIYGEKK